MTKNTSTPRNPPGSQARLAWYTMTATTASARNPSSPGRYGTPLIARGARREHLVDRGHERCASNRLTTGSPADAAASQARKLSGLRVCR